MRLTGIKGTVVVVTGAAGGIGLEVTRAFVDAGATVAAWAHTTSRAEKMAATLGSERCQRVMTDAVDVTDVKEVHTAFNRVERELGPVSVLVNVAGIVRLAPVIDLPPEQWAEVFAINTRGVFLCSQAAARRMVLRGKGTVITVGSNIAAIPRVGMAAPCASKAATAMFMRCLGLELGTHGIRCNTVSPGTTDTPMLRGKNGAGIDVEAMLRGDLATFRPGIPLGRLAIPADIAHAVLFLASEQARHITMQTIYVDGGAALGS